MVPQENSEWRICEKARKRKKSLGDTCTANFSSLFSENGSRMATDFTDQNLWFFLQADCTHPQKNLS
ncbi:MAG TPA: hypothetical protein P5195_07510, partial [Anaerolineae bacterium]|nr:hypothetical protein [Anaerolineae bacterium]